MGGKVRGVYSPANASITSWKIDGLNSVVQTTNTGESLPKKDGKTHFTFDRVMDESHSNREVYDITTRDIIRDFVEGYSASLIMYGQTGAGKTYTLQGPKSLEQGTRSNGGIIHFAASDLFSHIQLCLDSEFLIRLSVIVSQSQQLHSCIFFHFVLLTLFIIQEVYNEEIKDLLQADNENISLNSRYNSKDGMTIEATEKMIPDHQTMLQWLIFADNRRTVKATSMNERSSRSHTIVSFILEKRSTDKSSTLLRNNQIQISRLNLVDLAGSDAAQKVTQSSKLETDKEGKAINKR